MLNVIIVNDYSYVDGGASAIAIETAKLMSSKGHNVVFFSAVNKEGTETFGNFNNIKNVCTNQYDILNNPNRLQAALQGLWNFKAAKQFKRLLKCFSPEDTIIHIHAIQKAISSSIIPVAQKGGFKIIYHVHDYGSVCPNLGFFNYVDNKICPNKPMSLKCLITNCDSRCYIHKIWRVIRGYIQSNVGGITDKIDGVIFVSDFSKRILNKYIKNGIVINNPVIQNNTFLVKAEKNEYALYIGRLTPEKNPLILASVTSRLNIPVIFVGEGKCRKKIMEINPQAICTGWLNREQLDKYIAKARYLVFPSLWYETQGLVVAEVMAHGVPAIVSDCTAAKDYVKNYVNGVHFKENNQSDLEKVLKTMEDDKYVKYLSRNAYQQKHTTENDYANLVENYYNEILAITKSRGK